MQPHPARVCKTRADTHTQDFGENTTSADHAGTLPQARLTDAGAPPHRSPQIPLRHSKTER